MFDASKRFGTYFNPRSPHGERLDSGIRADCWRKFQSTLPARGATQSRFCSWKFVNDFNPRSPHGERRLSTEILHGDKTISIHAPRTGSDGAGLPNQPGHDISIHAPRTGSDGARPEGGHHEAEFQSTLPARGATGALKPGSLVKQFQSTLPARGATALEKIGTRPAESFQSTLPARGATNGK